MSCSLFDAFSSPQITRFSAKLKRVRISPNHENRFRNYYPLANEHVVTHRTAKVKIKTTGCEIFIYRIIVVQIAITLILNLSIYYIEAYRVLVQQSIRRLCFANIFILVTALGKLYFLFCTPFYEHNLQFVYFNNGYTRSTVHDNINNDFSQSR